MRKLSIVLGLITALAFVASAFAGMGVYEYKDGDMGKVTFDGKLHNTKLGPGKCMDCHKGNVPFAMKKPGTEGSAKIMKADHMAGKFCGTCHDGSKEMGGIKIFGWQEGSDCAKCHKKEEMKPEEKKEMKEEMKPEGEMKPEQEMKPQGETKPDCAKPEEKK